MENDLESHEATPLLPQARKIRHELMRKTYGTLGALLTLTFGIAIFLAFARQRWDRVMFNDHCLVSGSLITLLIHTVLANSLDIMQTPTFIFWAFPINIVFLLNYATAVGGLMACIFSQHAAESIMLVCMVTAGLASLLLASSKVFPMREHFMMVTLLRSWCLITVFLLLLGGAAADPQLSQVAGIFGVTTFKLALLLDARKSIGYSTETAQQVLRVVDNYASAAFELYLDIINLFLYLGLLLWRTG